jgi:hypothetical protein
MKTKMLSTKGDAVIGTPFVFAFKNQSKVQFALFDLLL